MSEKKPLARRLLSPVGRVISLALVLCLAAALFPYVRDLVGNMLPGANYQRISTLLTHEMEQVGDLIAVRHRDTGVMEAGMQALLVGSVNSVKAPYAYEIGLGISVKDVELTPEEDGITVSVPAARVLYDSFQITGEPEISDFWHLLGEENYQRLVDDQAAACRREYEDDPEILEEAWRAACGELSRLFAQWAGRDVPLRFTAASAADDPGAQ